MNFQTYARAIVGMLDNYMTQHSEADNSTISSWNEWNWIDNVYAPIYEAYDAIISASSLGEFITAVEWASHLNHASGSLITDYCYVDKTDRVLDSLEQYGLEKTFPKWEKQARKAMRRVKRNCTIPSPEALYDRIAPKCVYCGSDDIPLDREGEPLSLVCPQCQEKLDAYGNCLHCEHGIGCYGELCLDCALEYSEPLL